MSIHPPKHITSKDGLGLATEKTVVWHDTTNATMTEVWGEIAEAWREGTTIIAKKGFKWVSAWKVDQQYVATEIYDDKGEYIACYTDICTPVELRNGVFSFEDMYLDVWQIAGKKAVLLDEDELEMALADGLVTSDQAQQAEVTAKKLLGLYNSKI